MKLSAIACFSSLFANKARTFTALAFGALALHGPMAHAAYPERPIQVVVSFPPAGATDILARAIGQKMSESLGQPVVVENRPGAGGVIGLSQAAKASPDGYTIYLAAVTNVAIAAAAYSAQPVHLVKDFVPVAGVGTVPHMLVVPSSLPVQNVSQLIAYLKAAPGKYNFASQGAGTLSHLESEVFKASAGVDLVHVPYKGSSQALPDLMAGTSSMMFDSIPASMPHVKSGKLRVLAVASGKRVAMLPNVPTVDESGVKGFEANNLFGFSAPKGTPPAVIATLSKAIQTALDAPDLRQRMQEQGVELKFTPAAEFGVMVEQEFRAWGKAVEAAKVKLD
ncbi:MAG: receptor [Polaromonas sp. 39-63-203]|jgi:tripartite-type tricarboxylate transporter receptor subunit TctC|uniref:Bug family tripartite tricarboxylate transporter substrate binding protein n=1 Tax=Polaromonas sp. TaxID=1869339 RepID=UPI000BD12881|nr:tripartite tricarboxylate transporter substrate binding protein [Polaromonas sp.]OYY51710.1 MAG: receptor [Polaromonas sp. 35-63-240]OYY99909.1 MAG: receptor [Polaromonas sp. 28-63-22]OZB00117.1 MAG: receptor [Polaromonas sp. 39-63-203]HQS31162.1 tripartite tricarboxylate transporter substrate binding protein [Polaromonas sp.]HQS90298.1 tripartite tricarboxylate transporter substrate binding protein [Polaromonas sp.]